MGNGKSAPENGKWDGFVMGGDEGYKNQRFLFPNPGMLIPVWVLPASCRSCAVLKSRAWEISMRAANNNTFHAVKQSYWILTKAFNLTLPLKPFCLNPSHDSRVLEQIRTSSQLCPQWEQIGTSVSSTEGNQSACQTTWVAFFVFSCSFLAACLFLGSRAVEALAGAVWGFPTLMSRKGGCFCVEEGDLFTLPLNPCKSLHCSCLLWKHGDLNGWRFSICEQTSSSKWFSSDGKRDREIAHPCLLGHQTVKPHLGGHVSTVVVPGLINTECFGPGQPRCVHCAVSLCGESLLFRASIILLPTKARCSVRFGHKNEARRWHEVLIWHMICSACSAFLCTTPSLLYVLMWEDK